MRLLTDQDIYQITVKQLREWGHDVMTVKEVGLQQASDESLLRKGRETKRIFISAIYRRPDKNSNSIPAERGHYRGGLQPEGSD